jgi:hypothetical protein
LPASAPVREKPPVVTGRFDPTWVCRKAPLAPAELKPTVSPAKTPSRAAVDRFSVAVVVAS